MSQPSLQSLLVQHPYWVQRLDEGELPTLTILPGALLKVVQWLKLEMGMDSLVDLFGVETPKGILQSVVLLRSSKRWGLVRVVVHVPAGARVPSLSVLFSGADWFEREAWDMFGIVYEGHPNLKRLLTHWQFDGHPLRKDYPREKRQTLTALASPERLGLDAPQKGNERLDFSPAHPVTDGLMRLLLEVDEERIVNANAEIGYGHRGVEKEAEAHTWGVLIPYAERLNTLSGTSSSQAYVMAVEALAKIEVPIRAQWLRMILAEMGRIMEHSVALGSTLKQIGLETAWYYLFHIREACTRIVDRLTGSRVTGNFDRIGGFTTDVYTGFEDDVRRLPGVVQKPLGDVERLLFTNRLFLERTQGLGVVSLDHVRDFGLTGPNARAAGDLRDLRYRRGCLQYDEIHFERVVGTCGDVHDRVMVRLFEIKESLKIIAQSLKAFLSTHGQRICADVPEYTLPPLLQVYSKMQQMIRHFNLWTKGEQLPAGEVYHGFESPNGELGFYLQSDGSGQPWRFRVRTPGFSSAQAMLPLLKNQRLQDLGAILASFHIVSGELDR